MEEASLVQQNNHWIMDNEEEEEDELGSLSSSSSEEDESNNSTGSSISDFMEDAISSSSSSSSTSSARCPLYQMSDLMAELPIKRGLSKHFQGKSQSFTSLSSVRCLEDLAKPKRPLKKKLKPCKSYGWGLADSQNKPNNSPIGFSSSNGISKKPSRGSLPSLLAKRHGLFLGSNNNKPPVFPHCRSRSLLFA